MLDVLTSLKDLIELPYASYVLLAVLAAWSWWRFRNMTRQLDQARALLQSEARLSTALVSSMAREGVLTQLDLVEILQMRSSNIESLLQLEERERNPLTFDEVRELRELRDSVLAGGELTDSDVHQLVKWVEQLQAERPNHPGTWELSWLAAFARGHAERRDPEELSSPAFPHTGTGFGDDSRSPVHLVLVSDSRGGQE